MLTIKNNLPQVLHTSGVRAGEITTLIIPANGTIMCEQSTPLLDTHAKSRMVTISGTPQPVTVPPSTPSAPSGAPSSLETPTPSTTSGGKGAPSAKRSA